MLLRTLKHKIKMNIFGVMMRLMPSKSYQLFSGEGSRKQLCKFITRTGYKKILIVTDKPLVDLGIVERVSAPLAQAGVETVIFDAVQPDPVFSIAKHGAEVYRDNSCDGILAIGGGSSIDSAKMIGVLHTHSGTLTELARPGVIKAPQPPLFVIPTTSGTGSEATSGTVISDDNSHKKSILACQLPVAACLDPELLVGMPPAITAVTGMDALTHAVEAYLNTWNSEVANTRALKAVKLIFDNLSTAYSEGDAIEARDAMAHAAYLAGQAINENGVGNVHAIAHQLGSFYGIPHGIANAIVMPYVLDHYCDAERERMTDMARLIGKNSAEEFVKAVRELNTTVGISITRKNISEKDFDAITEGSITEGDGYPSPLILSKKEIKTILYKLSL